MTEGLKEKSKTAEEINLQIQEMVKRNRKEHGAYSFEEIQEISKRKWVLVSDAQQEIDQKNHAIAEMRDYLKAAVEGAMKLNDLQLKLDEWERERDSQKQKLKEKAIRLLQIRAGGRYRMFEAGMLYQCLVLLGMQEYTRHKQVDALVKITCHYFHESDAKKQLEELLK